MKSEPRLRRADLLRAETQRAAAKRRKKGVPDTPLAAPAPYLTSVSGRLNHEAFAREMEEMTKKVSAVMRSAFGAGGALTRIPFGGSPPMTDRYGDMLRHLSSGHTVMVIGGDKYVDMRSGEVRTIRRDQWSRL